MYVTYRVDQKYKQENRFEYTCIGIRVTQQYSTEIWGKNVANLADSERNVVLSGLVLIVMTAKFHVDDPDIAVGPS